MRSAREFLETIRIEHSVFALPFAYATLFLAAGGWPEVGAFLWVSVAMVAARTVGMGANRIIDARIDARNPRTAGRSIPAGRLGRAAALTYTAVALVVFVTAVYQLHPVCRRLWPLVIAAVVLYPYAKRFTPLAHLFLGAVYVMVPTSVWLAVTGELTVASIVLGAGAGLWVAGFDIIYACQDVDADRREGLHSLPADFGIARALVTSRVFHAAFLVCLVVAGSLLGAGRWYYAGAVAVAAMLVYEHRLVAPDDLSRIDAAFFTANGVVSIAWFVLIAMDTVS